MNAYEGLFQNYFRRLYQKITSEELFQNTLTNNLTFMFYASLISKRNDILISSFLIPEYPFLDANNYQVNMLMGKIHVLQTNMILYHFITIACIKSITKLNMLNW